jgi:transcription initiation factor TFIIB
MIDQGPEWRAFDNEQREKRARTGAPMTYTIHDKGLSTMIGWKNRDSYGKLIPTRNRAQLYRLRKWQRRIRISNATERNLTIAFSDLDRMASGIGLPRTVRETAAMIYRKAALKKLARGRSIEGITTAALYAACRQCHVPRTLDEISNIAHISRKEIGRTYRYVSRELRLKLLPTSPEDHISRFCSELKLSGDVRAKTVAILQEAAHRELTSGRGPAGMAAASLYIASVLCGERRTQREVADVAGVTEVTIRNRYKELAEKLDINIGQ